MRLCVYASVRGEKEKAGVRGLPMEAKVPESIRLRRPGDSFGLTVESGYKRKYEDLTSRIPLLSSRHFMVIARALLLRSTRTVTTSSDPRQAVPPLLSLGPCIRSRERRTVSTYPVHTTRRLSSTTANATMTPVQSKHKYDAKAGFDTSGASGLYHTARPDYPIPAIQSILSAALESAKGKPLNILEVGSGTGISTRSLLSVAAEQRNANSHGGIGSDDVRIQRYLSVEPSPGMRQDWQKNIVSEFLPSLSSTGLLADAEGTGPDVAVVDGTFENLSSAVSDGREGAYDLVLIAQAWHWCQDIPRSLDAIARALKPGGQLALIWNMEDQTGETGARWVKELRGMYEVFEDNTPQCE